MDEYPRWYREYQQYTSDGIPVITQGICRTYFKGKGMCMPFVF